YLRRLGGMIHGDDATAVRAASEKRLMILIESEVPEHHAPGPVPRRANHQMDLLLEKISLLPIAAGAFGEPDIFVRQALVQFVLLMYGVNGDASCLIFVHEPDELFRELLIRGWQKGDPDHGPGGFHPAGWAPGRSDDLQAGIQGKGFPEKRDDVGAIVIDGEVLKIGIARTKGLSLGQVVVTVNGKRKIARAHGLAQDAQADTLARTEKHLDGFLALSLGELVPEQP